jgi:hypothetical protein
MFVSAKPNAKEIGVAQPLISMPQRGIFFISFLVGQSAGSGIYNHLTQQ